MTTESGYSCLLHEGVEFALYDGGIELAHYASRDLYSNMIIVWRFHSRFGPFGLVVVRRVRRAGEREFTLS